MVISISAPADASGLTPFMSPSQTNACDLSQQSVVTDKLQFGEFSM